MAAFTWRESIIDRLLDAVDFLLRTDEIRCHWIAYHTLSLRFVTFDLVVCQAHSLVLLVVQLLTPLDQRLVILLSAVIRHESINILAHRFKIRMVQDALAQFARFLNDDVIFPV